MLDVTAMGELLIDFTNRSADENGFPIFSANPGGAPGNLLAALSAYGCSTAFLGKVGDDSFGDLLVSTLKKAGVETRGIVRDPSVFTTLAFVTIDSSGNRSFAFSRKPGADTRLSFEELDLPLIEECRIFHFGTLSLTDDPVRIATRRAVALAKERGKTISFDPNLRKPLWKDLKEARRQMLWGLAQADIVKISDEEVDFLWGCSLEKAAETLREDLGVKTAFITLGAKGCYFSAGDYCGAVSVPLGIHPVDTTGAGDIFTGAVLSRLLASGKPFDQLEEREVREAAAFACCAASASTQHFGGIPSVQPMEKVCALMRANA